MALRVYDLAKELKISSAALMKHLSDLGVEVRHHMNYLEDDITNKIRMKFRSEAENLKRIDSERKRIQDQLKETRIENQAAQAKRADSSTEVVENPFLPKSQPEKQTPAQTTENEIPKPAASTENMTSDTQPRSSAPGDNPREQRSNDSYRPREPRQYDNRPQGDRSREPRQYDNNRQYDNRPQGDRPREPRQYDNNRQYDNRPQGDRPREPRQYDNNRQYDNRPQGDRPREPRQYDNNRQYDNRPQGDRPREPRQYDNNRPYDNRNQGPQGDRPRQYDNNRQYDNRPQGDRPRQYDNNRQYDNRPQGDRPRQYDNNRPYDNRPQGDRPRQYDNNRPYDNRNQGQQGDRPRFDRPRNDMPRRSNLSPSGMKPSFDKVTPTKPVEEVKQEVRVFGKTKKVTVDDLGDKSKHLQAKLKNTKRKKGVAAPIEIDEATIEKNIKIALAGNKKKKKYKKEEKKSNILDDGSTISISEFTSVSELAKIMDVNPSEIISKFFQMGKMVSINQRLDRESLELICDEFSLDVNFEDEYGADLIDDTEIDFDNVEEEPRPPVITIMGHVDHGKTSILDYIRKTKVVAGESGGITQHIGAYQVEYKNQKITFLDTPGHEAFTAMRARGADVTDIAIIVVAANDGVKPQTIEAIDHARAAGVTMIIAINKIDLPEANIDRTIANMLEQNVYLEGWGGDVLWVKTSAATGEGIDDLLEIILLACEMKELKAKYDVPGKGVVIESRKDSRMGSMSTILLQEGTLKKGDNIVCGATYGHVRRMENERGQEILEIGPSDICVLYGLSDVPKAGDIINQVAHEKIARQISSERLQIRQEREKFQTTTNLNNLFTKIKQNEMSELRLIVKADTDGSVEAVCDSLQKLSNEEVVVNIIRKSVGGIMEADVNLASASDAIIIGFHVRANAKAKKLAEELTIEVKTYQIIFDAINDIKSAMEGMLAPEIKEKFMGQLIVKQTFKIKKIGTIAGCFVDKGSVIKTGLARVFRDDVVIHEGNIASLKHFDQEVNEVKAGSDCGVTLKDFNDLKEADVIEIYINEEFKRDL